MKISQLEYLFSNINRWISNADGKINIFIGVQLATIGLLIKDFATWYALQFPTMTTTEHVVTVLGAVTIIYSLTNSIRGIFPNLKSLGTDGELVYFGSIIRHPLNEFSKIIEESTDKQYKRDLVEQIYTNSHIASTKFVHHKMAVLYFISGLIVLIFMYIVI